MSEIDLNVVTKRFILGCWRLSEWSYSTQDLNKYIQQVIELGVNNFDHADIYGDYSCEELFGNALKLTPAIRQKIKLISKCGIKLQSSKFPQHTKHIYDTSFQHIVTATERSLTNLQTDYLDLLLIHRPDPLMDAAEIALAFNQLKKAGKVLNFGVSNFTPAQFELLQSYLDYPLQTNQIEASVLCHENFLNGNFDHLQMKRIVPQIWSPLAGGRIFTDTNEISIQRVQAALIKLARNYAVAPDLIALAWLLKLPSQPQIILGSGKLNRVVHAIQSININLSRDDWFELWVSFLGHDIA